MSEEVDRRKRAIGRLFVAYGDQDHRRAALYVTETAEIPVAILERAVHAVIRAHHWPKLPVVADLWIAAKTVAGMNRERYRAGRYLPAEDVWPPDGKRYAITAGEFEALDAPIALPAQSVPALTA